MQEQLLILQNQLTKEAREEFEKLVSSVQKNSEHSEELKSELAKYFQSKVDERVSKIKEREQEVTDEEVEEVWNDGPWGSRKLDVLRNSSVPSLFVNYKGHNVYTYPNRKGYFWEGFNMQDQAMFMQQLMLKWMLSEATRWTVPP